MSLKQSTTLTNPNSESFDINFKQIEQTNQILNNIEHKLSSLFRRKNKINSNSNPISRESSTSNLKIIDNFQENPKNPSKLFSNALIQESFINKSNIENDEEKKIQEDIGSLKDRLNGYENKFKYNEKNDDLTLFYEDKIKILEERIEILKNENKNYNSEKNSNYHELMKLKDENSNLRENLENIKRILKEKEQLFYNEKNDILKRNEIIKLENNSLLKTLSELQTKIKFLEESKNDSKWENTEMTKILNNYQSELEKIKLYSKSLSDNFNNEINKLQQDLKFQKLENESIREELNQFKNKEKSMNLKETKNNKIETNEENGQINHLLTKLKNKNIEDCNHFNELYNDIYDKKENKHKLLNYSSSKEKDNKLDKYHEEIKKLKELINTKIATKSKKNLKFKDLSPSPDKKKKKKRNISKKKTVKIL